MQNLYDFSNPTNYQQQSQKPLQSAYGYMDQAASNVMPSAQSLDRSQARLRSRIDTGQQANEQQIRDHYGSQGRNYSGASDQALERNRAQAMGAYSTGLAQTEADYENQRQQGAQALGTIGNNYGQLGLQQGQLGLSEALGFGKLKQGAAQTEADISQGQQGLDDEKLNAFHNFLNNSMLAFGQYGNAQGKAGNENYNDRIGRNYQDSIQDIMAQIKAALGM